MSKPQVITAWRQPTPSEVKFGYGAIHWAEFPRMDWQRNNGTLKRWIKRDGKRYNRI